MKHNHNKNGRVANPLAFKSSAIALCALLSIARAAFAATGTSAEFKVDLGLDGVRQSDGQEMLVYSSAWDGGVGATVTIAQDGVTLVEGLAGNGEWAWSVSRNGTYVLTHTTYTNGVVAKVASTTFVITTAALIPPLDPTADAAAVNEAVDGVGFADATVKAAIGGSAAEYAAFRTWAESVKNTAGSVHAGETAGEAEVVASPHAAAAYLLGAERLFENEPTVAIDELVVSDGESAGTTAMIVSATIKDGDQTVTVDASKVAAMFEATSDVTDWSGAAKLTPEVVVEDGEGEPMRFKVMPGDGTAPRAFLRIRK